MAQYDRDAAALAASASASPLIEAVGSLEELCSKSQTVVVSVAGEPAERAVFLGSGGLLEVAPKGSLFIDAGTVSVEFARELHTASAAAGMSFLDAPVSGGPEGAAKGTLSIMVGGSEADFDAAKPALDGMGGYVVRMGEPGAGAAAKLINQLLTASNALAATEALALAKAMGFESEAQLGEHCRAGARTPGKHALATTPRPSDLARVAAPLLALLERSWGNSTMLQRTGGIFGAASGAADPATALLAPAAAPLRNFAKDLDFVLHEAAAARLALPATAAARAAVSRAAALGRDDADWASVALQHPTPPHSTAAQPPSAAAARAAPAAPFRALAALEAAVPPPWREEERALLLRCAALGGRHGPLCVIDDDPTGTQTVHSVPVLADWSVRGLALTSS